MSSINKRKCRLTTEILESLQSEDRSVPSGSSLQPVLEGGRRQINAGWTGKFKLELGRYKLLFDGVQMSRLTVLVWLTYVMDYWGFTVAGKLKTTKFFPIL